MNYHWLCRHSLLVKLLINPTVILRQSGFINMASGLVSTSTFGLMLWTGVRSRASGQWLSRPCVTPLLGSEEKQSVLSCSQLFQLSQQVYVKVSDFISSSFPWVLPSSFFCSFHRQGEALRSVMFLFFPPSAETRKKEFCAKDKQISMWTHKKNCFTVQNKWSLFFQDRLKF